MEADGEFTDFDDLAGEEVDGDGPLAGAPVVGAFGVETERGGVEGNV